LSDLFGGAAAANSKTFAGRLEILKVTFDEAKESIGARLLPIIQSLVEFIVNKVVPALGRFADFFKPITDAIKDNKAEFTTFIDFIQKYVVPILVNVLGTAFKVVGQIAGGVINVIGAVIGGLNNLIAGAVSGINALIRLYNSVPFLPNVSQISAPTINIPTVSVPSVSATSSVPTISVPTVSGGSGSTSTGGGGVSAAAAGAAMAATPFSTALTPAAAIRRAEAASGGNNSGINVTVNGAIDAEGTARTIVNVLNDSFFRGTGGAGALLGATG
jgi:phage-related protein